MSPYQYVSDGPYVSQMAHMCSHITVRLYDTNRDQVYARVCSKDVRSVLVFSYRFLNTIVAVHIKGSPDYQINLAVSSVVEPVQEITVFEHLISRDM